MRKMLDEPYKEHTLDIKVIILQYLCGTEISYAETVNLKA